MPSAGCRFSLCGRARQVGSRERRQVIDGHARVWQSAGSGSELGQRAGGGAKACGLTRQALLHEHDDRRVLGMAVSAGGPNAPRRGWSSRRVVLLTLALVVAAFLGVRAVQAWQELQRPAASQVADTSSIRPWMSVRLIARAHRVPVADLAAQLGAPASGRITLLELARQRAVPVRQVEDETRRAVSELQATQPTTGPPPAREPTRPGTSPTATTGTSG